MASIYDSADIYDIIEDDTRYEMYVKHWEKVLGGKDIKSILDVSIGTGSVTLPVMDREILLSGSDLSESMLANCRKKIEAKGFNPDLKCSDFRNLSCWGDLTFDMVASTGNSLAYVSNDDAAKALREMDKHVNEGGYIYIDIRNWDKIVSEKTRFYVYDPFFVGDTRLNLIQVWDHNADGTVTFNLLYTFEKENRIYRKEKFEEHYIPLSKNIILKTLEEMGYHDVSVMGFPSQRTYDDIDKVDWFTIVAQK
jgi:ubiquinone/menaquinone biosynthesis C-methylase UbiE